MIYEVGLQWQPAEAAPAAGGLAVCGPGTCSSILGVRRACGRGGLDMTFESKPQRCAPPQIGLGRASGSSSLPRGKQTPKPLYSIPFLEEL